MRLALILALLASPAAAWEFSATSICILDHSEEATEMRLTYDPGNGEYAITVTRDEPWPEGSIFSMRFDGPMPIFIQTDRHVASEDRRSLTVTDRGFGNVLNGLQYNSFALSFLADEMAIVSLVGAAEEVAAFRACTEAGLV